jgi:hypothetical protein
MKPGPSKGSGGRPRKPAGTNKAGKLGYKRVTRGPKSKGKQVLEHRAKVGLTNTKGVGGSAAKGKKAADTTVHHKDGNKTNNSLRNLLRLRRASHNAKHGK